MFALNDQAAKASGIFLNGKIKFQGLRNKFAEYICVRSDVSPQQVVEYMFAKDKWAINKPNLILSISGGTKKFSVPGNIRKMFKHGLVKAAESTESIIITNGNNKLVGEAASETSLGSKLNVVGICNWNLVAFKDQLLVTLVSNSSQVKTFFYYSNIFISSCVVCFITEQKESQIRRVRHSVVGRAQCKRHHPRVQPHSLHPRGRHALQRLEPRHAVPVASRDRFEEQQLAEEPRNVVDAPLGLLGHKRSGDGGRSVRRSESHIAAVQFEDGVADKRATHFLAEHVLARRDQVDRGARVQRRAHHWRHNHANDHHLRTRPLQSAQLVSRGAQAKCAHSHTRRTFRSLSFSPYSQSLFFVALNVTNSIPSKCAFRLFAGKQGLRRPHRRLHFAGENDVIETFLLFLLLIYLYAFSFISHHNIFNILRLRLRRTEKRK